MADMAYMKNGGLDSFAVSLSSKNNNLFSEHAFFGKATLLFQTSVKKRLKLIVVESDQIIDHFLSTEDIPYSGDNHKFYDGSFVTYSNPISVRSIYRRRLEFSVGKFMELDVGGW